MTPPAGDEIASHPVSVSLPRLAEPLGPLAEDDPGDGAGDGNAAPSGAAVGTPAAGPFVVAGRRAFVAVDRPEASAAGALEVWAPPVRLAAAVVVEAARMAGARESAGGVERWLTVGGGGSGGEGEGAERGGAGVVERIVALRDGPGAIIEWAAGPEDVILSLAWRADLRTEGGPTAPGRLRWDAVSRGLLVGREGDSAAALFAFSAEPASLAVEAAPAVEGDAAGPGSLRVRASIAVPAGGSVRLAVVGGAEGLDAPVARRALRSVDRGRAAVRARQGAASQARSDRLSLEARDAGAGAALDAATLRLAAYLVDAPGGGRSLVAGYGPPGGDGWCVELRTRASVRGALAALAAGDFAAARDVLLFLARRQDGEGRLPGRVTLAGDTRYDDDAAAPWLLLVARYLAWTGDLRTVRSVWPAVTAALAARPRADGPASDEWAAALQALGPAAESLGEAALAGELGRATAEGGVAGGGGAGAGEAACVASVVRDAAVILDVAEGLLGAEPDAPRGRLVLRPRPPAGWSSFAVRSLAMGDSAVSLDYRREGALHRFRVSQERGGVPLQLVLAPELAGGLRAARVDGTAAELAPVPAPDGHRLRVPVQLVLDYPRTVELEMGA